MSRNFEIQVFLILFLFHQVTSYLAVQPCRYLSTTSMIKKSSIDKSSSTKHFVTKSESSDESLLFRDIINPKKGFDNKAIFQTLAGQGLLLNLAFLCGSFFQMDIFHLDVLSTEAELLQESVLPSLIISAVVITTGFFIRDFPIASLRQFFRERTFFVLRVLGLSSSPKTAALIATIISFGEAFADELFFRGFLFSMIHQQFGDDIALGISSLIYGLFHFPIFGSNIIIESFLGLLYGSSFLSANFNIVVPVIIHATYSLASMYVTWYFATQQIRREIIEAEKLTTKSIDGASKFESIANSIFNIIDLDKSGTIDKKELKLGLRLFG